MTPPLKIGDRVRVYRGGHGKPMTGAVTSFTPSYNAVHVTEDGFSSNHSDSPFHPRQCRRLEKRERRRVWIYEPQLSNALRQTATANLIKPGGTYDDRYIEFIEVRRKKVGP